MSSPGMKGPTGKTGNQMPAGYTTGQMQQYTPEMMELYQQMMSQVSPDSYLGRLAAGDEGIFSEIEKPALQQFQGVLGGIASKFSGMGMGGRHSSGFGLSTSAAAQDFAGQLQSQRQGLQQQAIKDLAGISSDLLDKKPFESFAIKKAPSFGEVFLESLAKELGALPGAYAKSQFPGAT